MPKKNGTGGEEGQRGRKVTHEKKKDQPFVAEAKWKIYGDPCPLSLRPVGPIRDLFFVVFLHLTSPSQTWPTVCSTPPERPRQNLHFSYQLTFCIAISGKVLSSHIFLFCQ